MTATTQRSGLGAQIGFGKETAYGTFKAPTRFLPFENESLVLTKNYVEVAALQAGQMAQLANLHKGTTRGGAGDSPLPFYDQGMGIFFDAMHEEVIAPAKIGTSTAYKQIHPIGLTPAWGKSYTCQVGRSDTAAGTSHPFSYVGGKLMSMKLSIDANGILQLVPTWDFQDEKTAEALGEATYTAGAEPFTFQEIESLIGGGSFANVLSMNLSIGIPKKPTAPSSGAPA
jgi:hypothetical protein